LLKVVVFIAIWFSKTQINLNFVVKVVVFV